MNTEMKKPPLFTIIFLSSLFSIDALMVTILMHISLKIKCQYFTSQGCYWNLGLTPNFCTKFFCNFQTATKNLKSYPKILSNSFLCWNFWKNVRDLWVVSYTYEAFFASKNNVLLLWDPPTNIKKEGRKWNMIEDMGKQ